MKNAGFALGVLLVLHGMGSPAFAGALWLLCGKERIQVSSESKSYVVEMMIGSAVKTFRGPAFFDEKRVYFEVLWSPAANGGLKNVYKINRETLEYVLQPYAKNIDPSVPEEPSWMTYEEMTTTGRCVIVGDPATGNKI